MKWICISSDKAKYMCHGGVLQNAMYGDMAYEHDYAVYSKFRTAPEFDTDINTDAPFGAAGLQLENVRYNLSDPNMV